MDRKKLGIGLGVAAAAVVGTVEAMRPRTQNPAIDARWSELSGFRYAHRGLHNLQEAAPENSLAAFERAYQAGYGAELDVHLTADDKLVVIHDSELERVTGEPGTVEEKTLDELAAYRLCGTDQAIPTLDEVLSIFDVSSGRHMLPLIVEVKTARDNTSRLMPRLMATLDAHAAHYCIESFDPRPLMWLKTWRPEVVRGQLAENFLKDSSTSFLGVPVRLALTNLMANGLARPDFIAYNFRDRMQPALKFVCEKLGAKPVFWTLRAPEELYLAERLGAVGIFENFEPGPRY